ncbi:hypothetical protein [Lishizhenia sp.]|nr:hypothetical protein [Lishizhenia sp.]MDX1447215.1 hypothetical protein [Lishizhenia sp.]
MNIKVLAWIIIALLLGLIAVELFVPKKIQGDKISVIGKSENV